MFDIAYQNEAAITAAEIAIDFLLQKILELDLSKPLAGFCEMCTIQDMRRETK